MSAADLDLDSAERVAGEAGEWVSAHRVDVCDEASFEELRDDVLATHQGVNMCSYTGLLGTGSMVAYSTRKLGGRGFTESLRMELTGSPVTVTLVPPGATHTSMMTNSPLVRCERKKGVQQYSTRPPGFDPSAGPAAPCRWMRRFYSGCTPT